MGFYYDRVDPNGKDRKAGIAVSSMLLSQELRRTLAYHGFEIESESGDFWVMYEVIANPCCCMRRMKV